ncbi:hypothetical protein NXV51_08275 [Bacteroides uniformis]|nr:hypothetical protein [Bacteroides uniformis]
MRNVMKYLGIMSVSLACAGPLFATSVQPFAGVTVVQQSVVTVKGQVVDEKGGSHHRCQCHCGRYDKRYDYRFGR